MMIPKRKKMATVQASHVGMSGSKSGDILDSGCGLAVCLDIGVVVNVASMIFVRMLITELTVARLSFKIGSDRWPCSRSRR